MGGTPTRSWPRRLAVALLLFGLLAARPAAADKIDGLIGQLRGAADYKVRLSAALNLAKVEDPRVVPALIAALGDKDKTVRGVVASGLGRQVTCDTEAGLRGKAIAALKASASRDADGLVKRKASEAGQAIAELGCGAATSGTTYINVGAMSASVSGGDALKALMRKTVQKTFKSKATGMTTEWAGGKDPTAAQLGKSRSTGFHVDGTLNEISVAGGVVTCKVSMLLATYPDKSMFGFLKGGAQVEGGSSASDVAYAKEDCVTAVIEDLIARKIIPTIQARTKR